MLDMRTSVFEKPKRRSVTWDSSTDRLLAELARKRRQPLGGLIGDLTEQAARAAGLLTDNDPEAA